MNDLMHMSYGTMVTPCGLSLVDETVDFTTIAELVTCPTCSVAPIKKRFRYKGFTCMWNRYNQEWDIYTRDEMECPNHSMRSVEMSCGTVEQCRAFIDSY
jgi:hypothetical protein